MDKNMFCFQCEQTIGCSGCTGNSGVCGPVQMFRYKKIHTLSRQGAAVDQNL